MPDLLTVEDQRTALARKVSLLQGKWGTQDICDLSTDPKRLGYVQHRLSAIQVMVLIRTENKFSKHLDRRHPCTSIERSCTTRRTPIFSVTLS